VKLSVVIPAHNEEGCLENTVRELTGALSSAGVDHEILVVNDDSSDGTEAILQTLHREHRGVRYVNNSAPHGFGLAVRKGLETCTGEAVAVYMADASDTPEDLLTFFRKLEADGVDCVFGSRFMKGSRVVDYPIVKLILNRLANGFIQVLFGLRYNDVTNAFKLYRRRVIDGSKPFLSHHYNLTVELPLKAIVRGYSYAVVPNQWINRKTGISKLRIQEMGSRYLFIVLYCFIERWLSRGDYRRRDMSSPAEPAPSKPSPAPRGN
jgi:dolichol-phosphate mannosyltransferase